MYCQAAARLVLVFRLLCPKDRTSATNPVAISGSVDGIGVAAVIDPFVEIAKLPKLSGSPSGPSNPEI